MYPFYRYGRGDPMAMLRGRIRTDPLIVTEIVENLGILPMSPSDMKESRRKLKEMSYRDTKTRSEQKALNELESSYYDLELTSEEEDFIHEASDEEKKELQEVLRELHEYIRKVQSKEVMFRKDAMKSVVEKAMNIVNGVQKRLEM